MVTLIFKKPKTKIKFQEVAKEQKPMEMDPETINLVQEHYLNKNVEVRNDKKTYKSTPKDNNINFDHELEDKSTVEREL